MNEGKKEKKGKKRKKKEKKGKKREKRKEKKKLACPTYIYYTLLSSPIHIYQPLLDTLPMATMSSATRVSSLALRSLVSSSYPSSVSFAVKRAGFRYYSSVKPKAG